MSKLVHGYLQPKYDASHARYNHGGVRARNRSEESGVLHSGTSLEKTMHLVDTHVIKVFLMVSSLRFLFGLKIL
jgi:hypothetical protein